MRANSVILVGLLMLAAFGAGMVIGGHLGSPRAPADAAVSTAGTGAPGDLAPVVKAPSTPEGAGEAASLAELEAALQKALGGPDRRGYDALMDLIKKVIPADIPQALALVEKERLAVRRPGRLLLLARWAKSDAAAAMAYAKAVPGYQDRQQAILAVLRAWAEKDGPTAAAQAAQLPSAQQRQQAFEAIASQWAQQDPQAALAWAQGLPEGRNKSSILSGVIFQWAGSDPKSAAVFLQTLPAEQVSPFDVGRVAEEWAALDPKAALAWANQLPPEREVRNHAVELAAGAWAQHAPQDAAAFAAGLPAGVLRSVVGRQVVSEWANSDPKAAAAWVAGLGEDKLREVAAHQLVESWTRSDPGSVSEWLQTFAGGAGGQAIVQDYINEACYDSPELVAPWAETLTDDNRRYNAIERVAREWGRQDRAAAEAWLAKVNLPDERKQGLLNAFKLLR
jgi:hypothetical protein